LGDSSDGDDGSLGIPLPVTVAVILILCVTVVTMMTVFLGYPLIKSRNRHATILLSEAKRRISRAYALP